MSSYRQLTAITLVSASIFYVWYRYCRVNSGSSVLMSVNDRAVTRMALGSLLCCGTNPFRKRKKTKGSNTAPYVQVKKLIQMDQQSANSTESSIQPDIVAPVHSVPPVQIETTAPPNETHYNNVAETHGTVSVEEIVVASAQNGICANPITTPDERIPSGTVLTSSLKVLQDNPDRRVHVLNGKPSSLENHQSDDIQTNSNSNVEGEIRPLNGYNLSSSKENIRSCNDLSIPDVTEADVPPTYFGQGMLGMPEYQIEETEPQLHNGVLVPQVTIPSDLIIYDDPNVFKTEFVIPNTLSGIIIGKQGKNVNLLKREFNADITITPSQADHCHLVLAVSCPVDNKDSVVNWILNRLKTKPSMTPIGNPYQLLRTLPLGQLTRVFIRSSYSRKHLFVTIADECYNKFLAMENEITADYFNMTNTRLQLYDPVVVGTIAVLKTGAIYSRVFIIDIVDSNPKLAICFLLDHGTFTVAPVYDLRKIKTRYMHIPFQAVSVMWAHSHSPFVDISDETFLAHYFNNNRLYVFPVRNETCCRSDVMFFNKMDPKPGSESEYQDILVQAVTDGYCRYTGKIIYFEQQLELNGGKTAYYFYPNPGIYPRLVFFQMANGDLLRACDVPMFNPAPQLENQQQHQQNKLVTMSRQQRQFTYQRQKNDNCAANGLPNNHHGPENGGNRGNGRGRFTPHGGHHPRQNHHHARTDNGVQQQ